MELKEIYEKIKTFRELGSMDPSLIDKRIRAGIEGKIRAAASDLPVLEKEYKRKVAQDCVIIAVKGKFGPKFAELSKEFKTVPIDYLKVVDIIGDSILKRGGKDTYTTREHLMTMDELNKLKMSYGIAQLPVFQSKFDGIGPGSTVKEALLVQLTNQYGNQLYSAITKGEIGNGALEIGFTGKTLPVVLYNYIVDLDTTMLSKPIDVLSISEEPTVDEVKEALLAARSKFTNK